MSYIAVLTSGGDSPGMNAAVASVARSAAVRNMPLLGIKGGYQGLINLTKAPEKAYEKLELDTLLDIESLPGTYLRTARCTEFLQPEVRAEAAEQLKKMDVAGLVVIGGDGSFHGAQYLCELGIPCIGIPGTIDNDLRYTEMTLGFDTAVNTCMEIVRSIRATSRSHDRPHVVEVMGRHCGDIALMTAAATSSEIVLIPEMPWSVDEAADQLNHQLKKGNTRATIIAAEGCWDSMTDADKSIRTHELTKILSKKCSCEARCTVVGYTQRGCTPTFRDSAFAFEAGFLAVDLICQGVSNQAIGIKNGKVFYMPIEEALHTKRPFDEKLYQMINRLQ